MNHLELLRTISRLEDLILAKAVDDPEYPALHARLMEDWDQLTRRDQLAELDRLIDALPFDRPLISVRAA